MRSDVRSWFDRRTFTGADFTVGEVVAAKAGRTVSVVLPARDEEATVGTIVELLHRELVVANPLIDELVVIDSNSTDRTAEIAREAGAEVHAQGDVLPELGDVPGKGEALWKSLAVTSGDIVAFVDSDLHDFDPHFVVGLLAPLIVHDAQYVKGCYDRPLASGQSVMPAGGGRVTELVARPLLNAYWPELAGVVQPLAGEYAGTREVLESVPFVAGYGVEIAMCIDVVEKYGLDALAQVDLGVRKHRNSSDASLGRMSMQIMLTVHRRLLEYGRVVASEWPGTHLVQFDRDVAAEGFTHGTTELHVGQRPPMSSVRRRRVASSA